MMNDKKNVNVQNEQKTYFLFVKQDLNLFQLIHLNLTPSTHTDK